MTSQLNCIPGGSTTKTKTPSFYKFWLSFFQGAKIPSPFAEAYAQAFNENRLKPDMLHNVNKEVLSDLGIFAMGDKFAILRHAQLTYEKLRLSEIDGNIIFDHRLLEDTDDDEENSPPPSPAARPELPRSKPLELVSSEAPPLPQESSQNPPLPLEPPPFPVEPRLPRLLPDISSPVVTFVNNYIQSTQVQFHDPRIQYCESSSLYLNQPCQASVSSYPDEQYHSGTSWSGYSHGQSHDFQDDSHRVSREHSDESYSPSKVKSTIYVVPDSGFQEFPPNSSWNENVQFYRETPPTPRVSKRKSRFSSPPRHSSYHGPSNNEEPERVKRVFLFDPPPETSRRQSTRQYLPEYQYNDSFGNSSLNFKERDSPVLNDTPIEGGNVGFKMLTKMGWDRGKSLGNGTGITEPIKVELRKNGRMGLGANTLIQDFRAKKYVKFVSSDTLLPTGLSTEPTERVVRAEPSQK